MHLLHLFDLPLATIVQDELKRIADLAQEHNLYVMSDEVYDAIVYDDTPHHRLASMPGMWDRTITLGTYRRSVCESVCCWRVAKVIITHRERWKDVFCHWMEVRQNCQ